MRKYAFQQSHQRFDGSTSIAAATPRARWKMVALTVVVIAVGESTSAQCPITLPAVQYTSRSNPMGVATGDFNGDGRSDVAVAGGGYVSVFFANADGTLGPRADYLVGSPVAVATADFNGDGRLDLAVANSAGHNIAILLGNPGGTFQAAVYYPVLSTQDPIVVAVGDFNADGRPDLVASHNNHNVISVFLGNGNGTFGPFVNYSLGGFSIVVSDFNNDGAIDLACASDPVLRIVVHFGNNDGTFQPATVYQFDRTPSSLALGDFNQDGIPDLATTLADSTLIRKLAILPGRADGTFGAPSYFAAGPNPTWVTAADINGDGLLDAVLLDQTADNIGVMLGSPGGRFQPPVYFAAGTNPFAAAVGNFNSDGNPDVVVSNSGSSNISLLLNSTIHPAVITNQPQSAARVTGQSVSFSVGAMGAPVVTYQWRRNSVNLVNGGAVSGATSPTLTINPVTLADNGAVFDCIVANSCNADRSNPAGLSVTRACTGDFNGDGAVNSQDFFEFLSRFFAGC